MRFQRRTVQLLRSAFVLWVASGSLVAAAAESLVIEPIAQATVARERTEVGTEHIMVIGSIRRINNQMRAERDLRATGDLTRISWKIPPGHTAREALQDAWSQLQQNPHTVLFFCDGRECGSSSLWANQVLGYSRLYGPEENQSYLALRLDGEAQRFVSLYAITRGNREVYLHMDQFTPDQPVTEMLYPTAPTLAKILQSEGELLLPLVQPDDPESAVTTAWLDLTARMLRTDNRLRIEVHGAQAPAFVQSLQDRGIAAQRLQIGEPLPEAGVRLVRL